MLDAKWKIFQMAAATCNFTQTAAALGMSQPNVTGQIRKLEQELGVALFIRDGRQLRLTRPGRVLLLEAESLLALSENAVRMARNAAADVLSFQLGATMTAGGYVLPPLAAEFMREHANRRIHLCIANTEEISDKLKKRFFDLALVEGAFDRELFLSRTLLADELLLAGSPRLPFFPGCRFSAAAKWSWRSWQSRICRCCCGRRGPERGFTRTGFSGNTASGPSVRGGFWS